MKTAALLHNLVPKHTKLSAAEKTKFLESNNLTIRELPKIIISDPSLGSLLASAGDIIKVERASPTAGVTHYYRVVINE
jgi:DNA-directed RNA polymerase subunit H